MKKRFTLIEIIAVIAVLGILAAIIIPNISNKKERAMVTQVNSNIRSIQTAMDMYALEHNGLYASNIQPTIYTPEIINFDILYPKYLKSLPENIMNEYYWVDFMGKVWGSTIDAPKDVYTSQTGIEWSNYKDARNFNIYSVEGNKVSGNINKNKITLRKSVINHEEIDKFKFQSNENFIISATDKNGLETAPVGMNYLGVRDDVFKPILSKEGVFEFTMESKDKMYWETFVKKELKPEGTEIIYEFSVENEDGTMTSFTQDFYSLIPSKKITTRITMIGHNGKLPSVLDFMILYHYEYEDKLFKNPIKEYETENSYVYEYEIPKNSDGVISITNIQSGDRIYYKVDGQEYPVEFIQDIPRDAIIVIEKDKINSSGVPVVKITPTETPVFHDVEKDYVSNKTDSKNELEKDKEVMNPEWENIQQIMFVSSTGNGQVSRWISIDIEDKQPENTRILYRYATGDGFSWSSYVDDFSKLGQSKMLRVLAILQVKKDMVNKVENPEVISIKITNEQGIIDLTPYKPSVEIVLKKDNNTGKDTITNTSNLTWSYKAYDPFGNDITEVEWSGDKRDSYSTPGRYDVSLRVKNSVGAWSNVTRLSIDVKDDKPIAIINPTQSTFSNREPISWDSSKSIDPDGDRIIKSEWAGDYSQDRYQKGNYVIKLRVQDEEGNWSDWAEKSFTVADNVFYNIDALALDNDDNTAYRIINKGPTKDEYALWHGDLSNKIIKIKMTVSSSGQIFNAYPVDDLDNPVPFINASNGKIETVMRASTGTSDAKDTFYFIMPENATKIKFETRDGHSIHTIRDLDEKNIPNKVQNINTTPDYTSITLNWDRHEEAVKYAVYRDGSFLSFTTGTTITDTPLLSGKTYTYDIRAVDSIGNFSASSTASETTLRKEVIFYGVGPLAQDSNDNTFENVTFSATPIKITWDGNLINRRIKLVLSSSTSYQHPIIRIKNSNNEILSFMNFKNKNFVNQYVETTTGKRTYDFIIPEGAAYIELYSDTSVSGSIFTLEQQTQNTYPEEISNIQYTSTEYTVSLTWNSTHEGNRVLVYRDNQYLATVTNNQYTDISLLDNTEYNYSFISLNSEGNVSSPVKTLAKTQKAIVSWRGLDARAFDENSSTIFTGNSDVTRNLTWDKDISLRKFTFSFKTSGSDSRIYVYFLDNLNNKLNFLDLKTNTMMNELSILGNASSVHITNNVIIPENTTKIQFVLKGTYEINNLKVYYPETKLPNSISNLNKLEETRNITLNWDASDDAVSYVIYRNNNYLTKVTQTTYRDTSLLDNTIFSYKVYAVDQYGNFSEPVEISTKTLKADISWRGANGKAFDGDENTYETYAANVQKNINITWDKDLTGKRIRVVYSTMDASNYYYLRLYANNVHTGFTDLLTNSWVGSLALNSKTKKAVEFIVPENTNYINFNTTYSYGSYTVNIHEISIVE